MSYYDNQYQASAGYYQAGPYVAPPPVGYPMRYGPQHHQQPPPAPQKTTQRGDGFCSGCCAALCCCCLLDMCF
ncbi:CYSTM1 family protein [Salix suchowensis]|nr:CYSTM1 family protein [Salix suchowensis]